MAVTQCSVNGNPSSADHLALGSTVAFGILNPPATPSYLWSIVDQPPGSGAQAVLSNPAAPTPTIQVENEGTYLVQCILNQGTSSQTSVTGTAIVRQLISGERVPANNESVESNSADGWGLAASSLLRRLDTLLGDPGLLVGVTGANGLAAGEVVRASGIYQLANGVIVPSWTLAQTNSGGEGNLDGPLGVIVGGVAGGSFGSTNALIVVRVSGLYQGLTGTPSGVGAPVFAGDAGVPVLVPGTYRRQIGVVVELGGGLYDAMLSGNGLDLANPAQWYSGLTTSAFTAPADNGKFAYISGASTVAKTSNAAASTARTIGAFSGSAAGAIQTGGVVSNAQFTTAGGSPANGSAVWLAASADDGATGAGKLTATKPVAGGTAAVEVGICLDNSSYAGSKTAIVLIQVKTLIQN